MEFNFEHTQKFFDGDVIIVTSSVYWTHSMSVYYFLRQFFIITHKWQTA